MGRSRWLRLALLRNLGRRRTREGKLWRVAATLDTFAKTVFGGAADAFGDLFEKEAKLGQRVAWPWKRLEANLSPGSALERVARSLAVPVRFATPDANYRIICGADRTIGRCGEANIARPTAPYRCCSLHGNSSAGGRIRFQKDAEGRAETVRLASLIKDEIDSAHRPNWRLQVRLR
jgi:hypothetical protein